MPKKKTTSAAPAAPTASTVRPPPSSPPTPSGPLVVSGRVSSREVSAAPPIHLHRLDIPGDPGDPSHIPTLVPSCVNHVAVIDCSGSMSSDLVRLRAALQAKLPSLVKEGDTVSLLWFSGRGEFGPLLEGETVTTLRDLARINGLIDRWLRPQGLTGFKEPIVAVGELIDRVSKKNGHGFSLFFMSDGMDNQWPREDVLAALARVAPRVRSTTIVEYGYYADRPMLAAMAERAGGQLIHADSFDRYEPAFEHALSKSVPDAPRVPVAVPSDAIGGIVFELPGDGEIVAHAVIDGQVLVSGATRYLWWLSPAPSSNTNPWVGGFAPHAAEYAALSLFAVRMRPDVVFPLLRDTGDVRFIRMFANCFGKQAYSAFMEAARLAAYDPSLRLVEGRDSSLVPAEDAFTVLDVLRVLSEDEGARLLLDDPSFQYSRITRKRVDADENLGAKDQARVDELSAQMKGEQNAAKLREIQAQIDEILDAKREALAFTADPQPDGVEVDSLTLNEVSPNVSVLVRRPGVVDLAPRAGEMPASLRGQLGEGEGQVKFPTFIFRNYAIVAHGILNVARLPVRVSPETRAKLSASGVRLEEVGDATCVDLSGLPILNRRMVRTVTLRETAELACELVRLRAAQKIYKAYAQEYDDGAAIAFTAKYGADAAAWLEEQGITAGGGFNPKRVQAKATDFILGKELAVKVKGYSTLPPVAKVQEKIAGGGKLNGPESLMRSTIDEVGTFLRDYPAKLHKDWVLGKKKANGAQVRAISYRMSQIAFSLIVGQVWFSDMPTIDDATVTVPIGGVDVQVTAELREVKIEL